MSSICLPGGDLYVPIKIEENDIYDGIQKLLKVIRPNWPTENLKFKLFTDGITNKLVACQLQNELNNTNIVLVRLYGNKTDLLIDRNAELRNIKILNKIGLAPEVYGIFENGLAYQYFPGVTLDIDSVLSNKIWPRIAQKMAKMHKVKLGNDIKEEPMVWDKIEQFLGLLPEPFTDDNKRTRFVNSFGSVTRLRIESERLKTYLIKTASPIVFAHNDLLLGNVIYNKEDGTVAFIDFEYATYNYQGFDIANHFNEFVGLNIEDIDYKRYPNEEFQKKWLNVYLCEYLETDSPSVESVDKIYAEVQQLSLASHFMWGIWSLVQFELSNIDFDFLSYAEIRLNRYFELKDKIFKELN
ncbi:unnamed protein product [Diatraea saccharalis]|uniref:ethanolamine kinase n=1 Tax=Diatraea saccharalis TaxID=40085 RepID=A0A9N9R985_9NEOP|nr:unnamed protein product [Diatraea saccharalis]